MKNKLINFLKNPVFIFCALIVIMTYPLILKIKTCMPGFFSTDESFIIVWNAWRIKFAFLNHFSLISTNYIAYPYGIDLYANGLMSYIWLFINHVLALLTTPVLTYNIQVILNFFLSAYFTYLLVYRLTKDSRVAIFSGIIFGFCPYLFVRSWQHLGETYIWPMPLLMWSLLGLKENDRLSNKSLYVLSLILAAINYAVIYYSFLILFIYFVYLLFKWRENKAYLVRIVILTVIALILLLPQFWPVFKNILFPQERISSVWNVYKRPFEDMFMQSARPLSYILPPVAHPIFGKITEQFIGSDLYGASLTEHTLYLGLLPLALAFFAFRKRKLIIKNSGQNYLIFFIFLAVVAWLFSQPPWWQFGSLRVYMPSFFMYKVLPMFRAYCRFGAVLMFTVAVLAGFGLKYFLERFKTGKAKLTVTILFCLVVIFEFWTWPPYKVIDVSKSPEVYTWLKHQDKDTVIAEYPLDAYSPNEMYKLYQVVHEKRMIDGTIPETKANKIANRIVKLSDPRTASILKWMKVKYVLVHEDLYLNTELKEDAEELKNIPSNPGLKLLRSFPAQECFQADAMCIYKSGIINLYEVVAAPLEPH